MSNTPPIFTTPLPRLMSAKMIAKRARAPHRGAFAYTWDDAAKMSGLSVATLRRLAKKGTLTLVKVGGRTLVGGDGLRRLVGSAV